MTMTIVENMKCSKSAGPGVFSLVDLDQNSGKGIVPKRAISCFTTERLLQLNRTGGSADDDTSHGRKSR
jgi:hypothetical protein